MQKKLFLGEFFWKIGEFFMAVYFFGMAHLYDIPPSHIILETDQ